MQVGRKVRDLRIRQGLTVHQLALAAGLSKGFISQVENGRTSPSLETLELLARALETSVGYLVVVEDPEPHVVRANARHAMAVGGNTSIVEELSALPRRNLQLVMAELPAGMSASGKRHYHHGEECVVCLEGRVSLTCGDFHTVLERGDACHYDGRLPHAVENVGAETARVLVAMTPAAFDRMIRIGPPQVPAVAPAVAVAGARS